VKVLVAMAVVTGHSRARTQRRCKGTASMVYASRPPEGREQGEGQKTDNAWRTRLFLLAY
jgi:hypothetical protein